MIDAAAAVSSPNVWGGDEAAGDQRPPRPRSKRPKIWRFACLVPGCPVAPNSRTGLKQHLLTHGWSPLAAGTAGVEAVRTRCAAPPSRAEKAAARAAWVKQIVDRARAEAAGGGSRART